MKLNDSHLIAIVDDDESVRDATTSLLQANGFRAETFPSGEALLASPLLERTRCLLLDIAMPGMTGLELQRRLIANGILIPIIFITAHDNPDMRHQAMRAGAVTLLPKPYSEQSLLGAIRTTLKS